MSLMSDQQPDIQFGDNEPWLFDCIRFTFGTLHEGKNRLPTHQIRGASEELSVDFLRSGQTYYKESRRDRYKCDLGELLSVPFYLYQTHLTNLVQPKLCLMVLSTVYLCQLPQYIRKKCAKACENHQSYHHTYVKVADSTKICECTNK